MIGIENARAKFAIEALNFIIPILNKFHFRWVITGGFACFVYGVKRPLTDIDIDIDTSKDSPEFDNFLMQIAPFVSQPLEHFVDINYDNYNVEITYKKQVVDICPMAEMNIFDKSSGKYESFYLNGFPETELVKFNGLRLPLLSKKLIIKNKTMLMWQRKSDRLDILGLGKLSK